MKWAKRRERKKKITEFLRVLEVERKRKGYSALKKVTCVGFEKKKKKSEGRLASARRGLSQVVKSPPGGTQLRISRQGSKDVRFWIWNHTMGKKRSI